MSTRRPLRVTRTAAEPTPHEVKHTICVSVCETMGIDEIRSPNPQRMFAARTVADVEAAVKPCAREAASPL